ncbi:MAG: glycine--tRNA ligase subunit beta [Enterobacteriaceae bacterium PSmelAO3-2]|nr:MAG: glycine--tRNA ligase subunit beta [Enterobacteriaceae bacterium PSmelAO3-2]WMC17791.1 MAG: glycine--tRNA ligase subunit beta [Enterobacteriaceae bacterium PSmelAO3-1]WMC17994.1 MAG: glycine--tRNA ligase subunit beta [Enterobacteriaceae bacterium PSmelAO1]
MIKFNFLIEIGTEDLPHKSLVLIAKSLFYNFIIELNKYKINYYKINWFATSRRLAIKINNLNILKFNKKKFLYNNSIIKKKSIIKLFKKKIIKIINNSLNKLNNFKKMKWNNKKILFIRPIRNIVILLNNKLIPVSILGIKSTRKIYGHHFMGIKKILIKNANDYPDILFLKCKVIANYNIRKSLIIKKSIFKIKKKIGIIDLDKKLLNELTSLVEWPVILIGNFKKQFLKYPLEPIIYIMKKYQKIFPIYNYKKIILPKFILILNIKTINSNIIIKDNERLLNYRLKDIENFFKKDCKKSLENNLKKLKQIIFQEKIGTLYEKIFRIIIISILLSHINKKNINYSIRLNLISKCDLIKNIVIEFPKLHGIIGMYYSHYYKESEIISISLNKKKKKNFLNNKIKKKLLLSSLLLISNKIDFLVGIFGIGNITKSKKDPFEIRRNALYILNTIIKKKIKLNLKNIIKKNIILYGNKINNNNVANDIINFIFKRFCFLYIKKGYPKEIIKSIKKFKFTNILNFYNHLKAIKFLLNFKKSYNLINSNKRILNIIYKSNNIFYKKIKISLLKEKYEIKLFKKIIFLKKKINKLIFKKKYKIIFKKFININKYINIFFNKIMIMINENKICINRLTILNKIKEIFDKIANIAILK